MLQMGTTNRPALQPLPRGEPCTYGPGGGEGFSSQGGEVRQRRYVLPAACQVPSACLCRVLGQGVRWVVCGGKVGNQTPLVPRCLAPETGLPDVHKTARPYPAGRGAGFFVPLSWYSLSCSPIWPAAWLSGGEDNLIPYTGVCVHGCGDMRACSVYVWRRSSIYQLGMQSIFRVCILEKKVCTTSLPLGGRGRGRLTCHALPRYAMPCKYAHTVSVCLPSCMRLRNLTSTWCRLD